MRVHIRAPRGNVKITLTSGHSIRLEGPPGPLTIEAESPDQEYSPFHMVASGLASCTYSVLYSWASNASLNANGLTVDISWGFAEGPHRVNTMKVKFHWPQLPPERRVAATRAAALCTVHKTLVHPVDITVEGGS